MKGIMYILIFLSIFSPAVSQTSFDIYEGDTINVVDENNRKQGYWIYFGNMKNLPGYQPEQKVEEGEYQNSRKQGKWIKYYPNGKKQNEITFRNSRPNGDYVIYYENGQIQEQGTWKNNRNIGNFKRFYENGQPQQEFTFNSSGKRDGSQKYYHENGQVMIEGDWNGGKESGVVKEYYANGDLKSKKVFNDGKMDAAKSEVYEPKEPVAEVKEQKAVPDKKPPKIQKDEKPNLGYFNGNGEATLYNRNKQISQKGMFKNGKLQDGKRYRYDKNGILIAIERYKDGRYVGDVPIEDDQK